MFCSRRNVYTVFINGRRAERSGLERMKTRSERPGLCLQIERLDVESYLNALLERKNSRYFQFLGSYVLHTDPKSEAILCVSQYV